VQGDVKQRVGNTTCLTLERVDAEALVDLLSRAGLAVSAGSACASGMTEPSHVLRAMGVSPARALGALRLSLSRNTTAEEVERALGLVVSAVAAVRAPAPRAPSDVSPLEEAPA